VLAPLGFSSSKADMCAFVGTITYVVGSYFCGDIADRYFKRRFKSLILVLLVCALVTVGVEWAPRVFTKSAYT
jgi:predicted MFS family arabinose efflux permease